MQSESLQLALPRDAVKGFAYQEVIDDICNFNWNGLAQEDLINVAWAYYHFSVQFRENLEIARSLYPDDERLLELDRGERDTDNLSPWPGVAAVGERMHHDEFMRRTLELTTISEDRKRSLAAIGQAYLTRVRAMDDNSRAMALASYEDGGLERVFRAMLTAQHWNDPVLQAFKHFLERAHQVRQRSGAGPWSTLPASHSGRTGYAFMGRIQGDVDRDGAAIDPLSPGAGRR